MFISFQIGNKAKKLRNYNNFVIAQNEDSLVTSYWFKSKCIIYNYGVNVIIKRTENKCVIYNLSERIYKQDEAKGGGNSVL